MGGTTSPATTEELRMELVKSVLLLAFALTPSAALADAAALAPTGTLRAVYLAGNPAQAVRDPASGETRGASADLARELGRKFSIPVSIAPSANPQTVIEAVAKGEADIGFVAYAPSRTGTVEFSQTYMLVRQSFLVPEASQLKSVSDIDKAGLRISGGKGDSVTLFLARTLKQATLVETDGTPVDMKKRFDAREIDAFAANRQRLTNIMKDLPGYRILPDNVFDVPQTIVVGKGNARALAAVNFFIDDVRQSGFLKSAIDRSGIVGIDVAPSGYGYGRAE
jgi:polar amino acid transport system substrate-binding protein